MGYFVSFSVLNVKRDHEDAGSFLCLYFWSCISTQLECYHSWRYWVYLPSFFRDDFPVVQQLIESWAPIIWLHSEETFWPSSVEFFLPAVTINDVDENVLQSDPTPSSILVGELTSTYHMQTKVPLGEKRAPPLPTHFSLCFYRRLPRLYERRCLCGRTARQRQSTAHLRLVSRIRGCRQHYRCLLPRFLPV